MPFSRSFVAFALLLAVFPLQGRTRKGDKLLAQGRAAEERGQIEQALEFDRAALAEDPADTLYQLNTRRLRFKSAELRIRNARKIRETGDLAGALAEFQRAWVTDPASPMAQQEVDRTKDMIERERRRSANPGAPPEEASLKGLTPIQAARKLSADRIDSIQAVPELKPTNNEPITLKMNNQKPRVIFETLGKLRGINVLFDPEYEQQNTIRTQSLDLTNSTLDQALDYTALLTKSFWKPLSGNAIFVTLDNTTKRHEFEEQVVKVFYLKNITLTTELQEIITALRTVADIQKLYQYTAQNALVVRCEADRMLLAEKIISDLDKPKSEVIVDVIVMEVKSDHVRNLGAQIAPGGINSSLNFTGNHILGTTTTTTSTTGTSLTGGTTGTVATTGTTSATGGIPLPQIRRLASSDYSISGIPGAFIEALLSDSGTKVMQSPQLRAVDHQKVSLHIGDKVPTASGSFGSGIGGVGVGVSPLVQTQFTYIETGVNMDMTPTVHDGREVSIHVEIDISQVTGYRDVGGVQQPIISQRKIAQDIRTVDGEINLVGGLIQEQDSKTKTGLPGLSSIPLLNRLFNDEKTEKAHSELLITLIPHILRSPDPSEANLRAVASGNFGNVHLIRGQSRNADPAPATPAVVIPDAAPAPSAPAAAPTVPPAPTPSAPAVISFLPAQVEAPIGSAVSVTVRADNVTDLNAVVAQLKFDPKILRINNIAAGDLIQQTGPPLNPSRNILNDTGDANISVARMPGGPGVSGSGGLFVITFQAVGRGVTTVSLPQLMLRTTPGQPQASNIPALTVHII